MATFGNRIKARLDELHQDVMWLAKQTGMRPSTLYGIVQGAQSSSTKVVTIAAALGLEPRWLESERGPRLAGQLAVAESPSRPYGMKAPKPQVREIPLVSWVAASAFAMVSDPYPVGQGERFIPVDGVGERAFALRVRGPSMEPEFSDGAIIVVDPHKEPRSGDYVVVRMDDADEATFKELRIEGGQQWLRPLNQQFPALSLDRDGAQMCGVVVKQIREY